MDVVKKSWLVFVLVALASCNSSTSTDIALSSPPITTSAPRPVALQEQWIEIASNESGNKEDRVFYAQSLIRNFPDSPEATRARDILASLGESTEATKWSYRENKDAMSGKVAHSAVLTSENSVQFSFPYEGQQNGKLTVRRHPEHGNDVIVSIERGQILCHSFSDCQIRIAFDKETPRTISGTGPADGSSETVFLPGYASLTRKMTQAKEMRVQFNVYQQGAPVLVFDVHGFDPTKLK